MDNQRIKKMTKTRDSEWTKLKGECCTTTAVGSGSCWQGRPCGYTARPRVLRSGIWTWVIDQPHFICLRTQCLWAQYELSYYIIKCFSVIISRWHLLMETLWNPTFHFSLDMMHSSFTHDTAHLSVKIKDNHISFVFRHPAFCIRWCITQY